MGLFDSLLGTALQFFQIGGPSGPGWQNNSGVLQSMNATQSALSALATAAQTITGAFTQSGGAFSLTGNAASGVTTSAGNTAIDSAAVLNLGPSTATATNVGRSGTTTTVAGSLSVNGTGACSIGPSSTVTVGGGSATSTIIGRSGATTTVNGSTITETSAGAFSISAGGTTAALALKAGSTSGSSTAPITFTAGEAGSFAFNFGNVTDFVLITPTSFGVGCPFDASGTASGSYIFIAANGQGDNTGLGMQLQAGASASGGTPGANMFNVLNADGTTIFNMVQNTDLVSVQMNPGSNNTGSIGISSLLWSAIWATALNVKQILFTGTVQTTVGLTGTASALPGLPQGYFQMSIGGTVYAVPYYKAS